MNIVKMKMGKWAILGMVSAGILASCSSSGDLTAVNSEAVASTLATDAENTAAVVGVESEAAAESLAVRGLDTLPPRAAFVTAAIDGTVTADDCVTETQGADADGDGVPSNYSVVFDCVSTGNSGSTSLTGKIILTDDNDNDALSGIKLEMDNLVAEAEAASGAFTKRTLDGSMDVNKGAASATSVAYTLSRDYGLKTELGTAAGDTFAASTTFKNSATVSASVSGNDIGTASWTNQGSLNYSASSSVEGSGSANFTLSFDADLTASTGTCDENDEVIYLLNGDITADTTTGKSLDLTFSGCSYSFNFSGTR